MPSRFKSKLAHTPYMRISAALRAARQVRKDAQCLRRIIRMEPPAIRPVLEIYFVQRMAVDDIAAQPCIATGKVRRHILQAAGRFDEEQSS